MLKVTEHEVVVGKNCLNPDWDTRYSGWILIWLSFISPEKFQDTAFIRKTLILSYFLIYYLSLDIPHLSMSTPWRHMENGDGAPLILDLGIKRRRWSSFSPNRFTPDKESHYPLNRKLGRTKSQCGRFSNETIYCLYRDSNTGTSNTLRVAMPPTVDATEYRTWIFQLRHSLYPPHNSCIWS
jgi:hypothetical protein